MGLPPSSISIAGKAYARARLVVLLPGAAPARTGAVSLRPSLPFAAEGARFSGGGRGDGDQEGGAAELAGVAICATLRRPAAPAFKKPSFSSYGGARLAGRAMHAALRLPAANKPSKKSTFPSYGGAQLAGRATYAALGGAAAVLCLARRVDGEDDGAGVVDDGHGGVGAGVKNDGAGVVDDGHDGGVGAGVKDDGVGGAGDICNTANKAIAFNHGKAMEGAPAAGGRGGGPADGDKAAIDLAPSHRREELVYALGWVFVQASVTLTMLALVLYAVYKIYLGRAYAYAYAVGKNTLMAYLKDEELQSQVRQTIIDIVYPWLPWRKVTKWCTCIGEALVFYLQLFWRGG